MRSVSDAIANSNVRRANREVANFLARNGDMFTDEVERQIKAIQQRLNRLETADVQLTGTTSMLMSIAMNKLRVWRAYRDTVFQLKSLAERELSDLGIARRDIKRRAREATWEAHRRADGVKLRGAVRLPRRQPGTLSRFYRPNSAFGLPHSASPRPRRVESRCRFAQDLRPSNFTSSAPTFSSRYLRRLVPGIGTMSLPCASTHASASCDGVQPFARAIVSISRTRSRFFWKFSPWKRGELRR